MIRLLYKDYDDIHLAVIKADLLKMFEDRYEIISYEYLTI